MSYFSRLTDIVTCSLTKILAEESDPRAALAEILREMEEGLAGAKRSVTTATANQQRFEAELAEHRAKIDFWTTRAKEELTAGHEELARRAIVRKHEIVDLIAGLEQQLQAAIATREHLHTTQRALEARLAEARRKQAELQTGSNPDAETPTATAATTVPSSPEDTAVSAQVDAELEALKRELDAK